VMATSEPAAPERAVGGSVFPLAEGLFAVAVVAGLNVGAVDVGAVDGGVTLENGTESGCAPVALDP
jgi:hypothetical protein